MSFGTSWSLIPDGAGPIAAAIVAVGSAIAWALKAGLNRLAKSFDRMIASIDANTPAQSTFGERVTRMEGVVNEGREDIREMRGIVEKLDRPIRPGRRAATNPSG